MDFRTEYKPQKAQRPIDHHSCIVMFGSCFSENIGSKLDFFKFEVYNNPFGILYHPMAVEKALTSCLEQKRYKASDLMEHQGLWISLDHHGSFNHHDPETVLQKINEGIASAYKALTKASHVVLTLGTAWAYRWKETGELVANCHKIPQTRFRKELLEISEITESLKRMTEKVHELNPGACVVWTLSPVRHLKDGFLENNRSKARLLEAIHSAVSDGNSFYFPSYELMMDDLRDYRFYDRDLVHPNALAIEYIWEKFKDSWISESAREVMKEIEQIQRALEHRPFHPTSEAHQEFLVKTRQRIESLSQRFPSISFKKKGSAT